MGVIQFTNGMKVDNIETVAYVGGDSILVDDGRSIRMIQLYGGFFDCCSDFQCTDLETIGTVFLELGSKCKNVKSEVAYIPRLKGGILYNCGVTVANAWYNQVIEEAKQSVYFGNRVRLSGQFAKVVVTDESRVSQDSAVCLIESGASVQNIRSSLAFCMGSISSLECVTCNVKQQ